MKLPAFLIATIACAIKIQTQVEALITEEFPPIGLDLSKREIEELARIKIEDNTSNASVARQHEIMKEMKSMFYEPFSDSKHGYESDSGKPEMDARSHVWETLGFDADFGRDSRASRIHTNPKKDDFIKEFSTKIA
jgi:hypothetical protein